MADKLQIWLRLKEIIIPSRVTPLLLDTAPCYRAIKIQLIKGSEWRSKQTWLILFLAPVSSLLVLLITAATETNLFIMWEEVVWHDLYSIVGRSSLSTLSTGSIWEDRGEEGLLTWGNKEFSIAIWDSASSGRASHGYVCLYMCVCDCTVSSCLSILLSPPPLLSPLSSLCLSPSNKAEYLFPPLRLSGLLKGVGDRADIRQSVCVRVCLYVRQ